MKMTKALQLTGVIKENLTAKEFLCASLQKNVMNNVNKKDLIALDKMKINIPQENSDDSNSSFLSTRRDNFEARLKGAEEREKRLKKLMRKSKA